MSTAVVPYEQLTTMAAAFAKSGMFGAKTQEQALSLLLLAQAEGVHPAMAMRDFDIIQGRPSKKAQAMHRDFLAAGGKIEWHKRDDNGADATFSHPHGGSVRVSWDAERARKAGLSGKDMYGKYARQMYSARVISEGCRAVYPAATSGLYTPHEAASMGPAPEKDMGSAVVVDDDVDVTQEIPGAGAPQPASAAPHPSSSSLPPAATDAGTADPINEDQLGSLLDRFNTKEPKALDTFLKIAKLEKLAALPAGDYDEALVWMDKNLPRFKAA
jgi:hypothetical protein